LNQRTPLIAAAAIVAVVLIWLGLRGRHAEEPTAPVIANSAPAQPLTLTEAQYQTPSNAAVTPELDMTAVKAAQAYRGGNQAVLPLSDSTIVAEAEEFHVAPGKDTWRALPWGANYYASTFANTFLSRKAFLSAPEESAGTNATIQVQVPKAGRYLALVRYEAAVNFETQFHLKVEQNGQSKLDRLYGARDNLKIWAFKKGLLKEVTWDWGPVENEVWEGQDAYVDLAAGTVQLTLTAGKQPAPAARRNVDVVMLTSDEAQVKDRIAKENYLPLDGMLTQAGDVYVKIHNSGAAPLTLNVPPGTEHSPYWIHVRDWKAKSFQVAPGQTTDWNEVGSLLDTFNDGQWKLSATPPTATYDLEFGVRDANGKIVSCRSLPNLTGDATLAYRGDMRYMPRIRTASEVLHELVDYLKRQPVRGKAPQRTLVYGLTFEPDPKDPAYNAAIAEFISLMGANSLNQQSEKDITGGPLVNGYIDVRGQKDKKLADTIAKLQSAGKADKIAVVSLGDEIDLTPPSAKDQSGFQNWLRQQGVNAADVDPAAGGDINRITYNGDQKIAESQPALFYYSSLYAHYFGIQTQKAITDVLRRSLPNAGIGANYSPHRDPIYLGQVHQWVTMFREGAMTMPWSEDYAWQLPIGSQQMSFFNLDLMRCAVRNNPSAKIQMYVMAHFPGNTPNSWRRQFYGAIGHGAKILNLFELRPPEAAYTENWVALPAMYQEVRKGLYELGQFEDIVQDGQVRPGVAALWCSETGDIWNDNRHPFDAGKRTLYVAIRGQQLPLDIMVEQDAVAGELKNYKVLYLTDRHVSAAATKAIASWVAAGGHLFATAGAGMFDELNQPNQAMRGLLGADEQSLQEAPQPIRWGKNDLQFAAPLDKVALKTSKGDVTVPVFGARSHFTVKGAMVQAKFGDGSPAVVGKSVGAGGVTYCGFMPGLSYFKPAIPARPADRGSTDAAMDHFIPTHFDRAAGALIGAPAAGVERPLTTSNPLVDTTIIEARSGAVIPLTNWSGGPLKALKLTVNTSLPAGSVTLASGRPVKTSRQGKSTVYSFDLDVADALILR
jgi:hypothetical protein